MVDRTGFEPATSAMPRRRSTTDLPARSIPTLSSVVKRILEKNILAIKSLAVQLSGVFTTVNLLAN